MSVSTHFAMQTDSGTWNKKECLEYLINRIPITTIRGLRIRETWIRENILVLLEENREIVYYIEDIFVNCDATSLDMYRLGANLWKVLKRNKYQSQAAKRLRGKMEDLQRGRRFARLMGDL